jgi:2-polyprenyl-6-methoxyphenol hydroxylase-like FAD-dependent oxidoreductase
MRNSELKSPNEPQPVVLIVGAGPTGLFLAYCLARQGIRVRIVDRDAGSAGQSRALVVHARTLEFYEQFGLAEKVVALGMEIGQGHVFVKGEERATFSFHQMGAGISKFPFALALPQDIHERFLTEQLTSLGIEVSWGDFT